MCEQLTLFEPEYHCVACGRVDAPSLRKIRRFRVCPDCWEAYVEPALTVDDDAPPKPRAAVTAFWEWYLPLDKRLPRRYSYHPEPPKLDLNFNPVCRCGRLIDPLPAAYVTDGAPAGLFGGPFNYKCEHCRVLDEVRFLVTSPVMRAIKPRWDDEDWLDYLYQYNRRAFEIGVLPELWFEVKRACMVEKEE